MGELSIEEKAKAYDEAIERARKINSGEGVAAPPDWTTCEVIFPELKESEDERIRLKLIEFFAGYTTDEEWWGSITEKDILAWLEKQSEQKVPINDFKAKNWYVSEVDGKIHDMTYNPADKVEPKFKVGDWVVSHYNHIAQIKSIDEKNYFLSCNDGNSERLSIDCINRNWRLWSTQDAKDGDILVMTKDKAPFIFKGFLDKFHPDCPVAYGGIVRNGTFDVSSGDGWWDEGRICPATKEQRDLLFQKMEEAEYEWDAEKKELKKIEQNPAWSKEDEKVLGFILTDLETLFKRNRKSIALFNLETKWLKSLKERYIWKPSDEQIKGIECAIKTLQHQSNVGDKRLDSLYNDLKKLKR